MAENLNYLAELTGKPITIDGMGAKIISKKMVAIEGTGQRIRWLRERKGLTQVRLAEMLGLRSSVFLSDMEKGVKPPIDKLVQLARILDTSTDYLLCIVDNPEPYGNEDEPQDMYISPEADEIARMVDAMPAWKRVEALYMVRASAAYTEEAHRRAEAAAKEIAGRLRFAGAIVGDEAIEAITDALTRAWTNAPPD